MTRRQKEGKLWILRKKRVLRRLVFGTARFCPSSSSSWGWKNYSCAWEQSYCACSVTGTKSWRQFGRNKGWAMSSSVLSALSLLWKLRKKSKEATGLKTQRFRRFRCYACCATRILPGATECLCQGCFVAMSFEIQPRKKPKHLMEWREETELTELRYVWNYNVFQIEFGSSRRLKGTNRASLEAQLAPSPVCARRLKDSSFICRIFTDSEYGFSWNFLWVRGVWNNNVKTLVWESICPFLRQRKWLKQQDLAVENGSVLGVRDEPRGMPIVWLPHLLNTWGWHHPKASLESGDRACCTRGPSSRPSRRGKQIGGPNRWPIKGTWGDKRLTGSALVWSCRPCQFHWLASSSHEAHLLANCRLRKCAANAQKSLFF